VVDFPHPSFSLTTGYSMSKARITRTAQFIVLLILALATTFVVGLLVKERPVHALPEYATRTGEPCGACHVNPGGGGPRTMSGLLWSANGNPDEMPAINIPIAPDVSDGQELYDIACASCHGLAGEGLFGPAVVGSGLQARKIESSIVRGRERSGMPAYDGQLTDEQLAALVDYTAGLSSGQIEPPPNSFPLAEGQINCEPNPGGSTRCGGN
jgi:mono/diheme cytochrome c family protein